jgi:outer membrane protein, heavy metal efflux system
MQISWALPANSFNDPVFRMSRIPRPSSRTLPEPTGGVAWLRPGLPILLMGLLGCVTPTQDLGTLSNALHRHSGHGLGPTNSATGGFHEDITRGDGLSEDEAVTIALMNNPAFRELLTDLGLAQGDLVQAGMLPNPRLAMLVPVGIKPLELTATYPLEVLWLRPRRVRAAVLDLDRTADRLIQTGLDLIRDVRLAFTEVTLARDRIGIADETLGISHQIADLVQARFRAGDASELEAATSRLEALQLREQKTRLEADLEIAMNRLRGLLGLGLQPWPPAKLIDAPLARVETTPSLLITNALAARPDLRAAELGMEAAGERIGLARAEVLTLAAGINVKDVGTERVSGPALELAVPLFNQNQGGVAIARARFEKAALQYVTVRERIVLEVREAHLRLVQAQTSLDQWDLQILPGLKDTVSGAEHAFAAGNISYLFVLESSRRLADARLRGASARADVHRARAELERSVGERLSDPDLHPNAPPAP